ncbi:MAG TPA: sulfotransferase domain-containing protein [Sideroxyarcus sp.]|nr:sulfotransferase domain-containing protein [Sideroxyarcus sp.]
MVDFIFLGPSKTASTWIFEALRGHPDLFVPVSKDVYFFDEFYHRGADWYAGFFKDAPPGSLCGELSHDYFSSPEAIRRLHAFNPQVKLICCLRNPFERAYSSYLHLCRVGLFAGSFEAALQRFPFLVDEGKYCTHLQHILSLFERDMVLILDFDELQADPQRFARGIFRFLGVDEEFVPAVLHEKVNPARIARSVSLAKLAKLAALQLRQWGCANLIGRLKHSRFINWLIYRPVTDDPQKPEGDACYYPAQLVQIYHAELEGLSALLESDYSKWRIPSR